MKFSIVMPSFNQAKYVEAALQSVLSQNYTDFEIIFMDGGSTDGTMELVEKYRPRLAHCTSARDAGQSDALTKGFALATGSVLTWLNTDDLLLPGALAEAAEAFRRNPGCDWILGNVALIDAEDRVRRCWLGEPFTPGWMRLGLFAAGGPSTFFRRTLYARSRGIDKDLHYQMDTELWWQFAMLGARFYRLRNYTWALRLHADAKTSGHMFATALDKHQATVADARRLEELTINARISPYVIVLPKVLRTSLSTARRLLSARYLLGLAHSLRFRNRPLGELMAR